jgi:hypothetical protein
MCTISCQTLCQFSGWMFSSLSLMFKFVFLDVQRFKFYWTPYHLELESNFFQVNTLGTHWEQGKNENKILSHRSHPKLKRKKSKAPWVHAWAFQLAAWNFSSQKSSSPFFACPKTPCQEHPTNSSYLQLVANKTSHEAKRVPINTASRFRFNFN